MTWSSKKQETTAQSTAEAEFIAANSAAKQAIWLEKIMIDLLEAQEESTKIFVDNQAAIAIAGDPVFQGKTKHFRIKIYYLREVQKEGEVRRVYCQTKNQWADILTKVLVRGRFEDLRRMIGICSSNNKEGCC